MSLSEELRHMADTENTLGDVVTHADVLRAIANDVAILEQDNEALKASIKKLEQPSGDKHCRALKERDHYRGMFHAADSKLARVKTALAHWDMHQAIWTALEIIEGEEST